MTGFLKGVATAMITPFHENGVNFHEYEKMIDNQINSGADAIIVLGTTGEPSTMTDEERTAIIKCAVKYANGRIKVIVGTGSNCTATAIKHTKQAEELGADGVLVVTPYYNKCTQNGLYEYYRTIAASVHIPVVCYNVPSRTGVNILPTTMAKIAEIPNVAGIKEASGNMTQIMETARLIRGKCDLYSGEDSLNFPILAVGGTAVVSVVSNLLPKAVKELCDAVSSGNLERAAILNDAMIPVIQACFIEVNPIPVKAGMNLLGFSAGEPRAPLTPLESEHLQVLKNALRTFGAEVVS